MQGQGDACAALDEADCLIGGGVVGVVEEADQQPVQAVDSAGGGGVGCGVPGRGDDSRPSVAEGGVGDAGELGGVGQAPGEGVLGRVLAGSVVESEGGELLGAGDAGGAVAPRGAGGSVPVRAAVFQFVEGDPLGPPGSGGRRLAPDVQVEADGLDGVGVPVDRDALAHREGEQGLGGGDAVGHAEVRVPVVEGGIAHPGREVGCPPAWCPASGGVVRRDGPGEADQVVENPAEQGAAGIAPE